MGETTEIIRRRIHHWKTTVIGVVMILAPVALVVWPEHTAVIQQVIIALTGAGFIAAADARKQP